MKKMKASIMLVFLVMLGLTASPDGFAAIYKYIDNDGMINFADDLQSVPVQHRAQAVIVSGEEKEPEVKKPENQDAPKTRTEAPAGTPVPATMEAQPPADAKEKGTSMNRFLVSSIVVVSALFAFVILGVIDADHKKSIKIVRIVILWGVSVFLLYSHAMDVVNLFRTMGKSVSDSQQRAEEKGKKAVKAMKELGTLLERAENPNSADPSKTDTEQKD